MSSTDTAKLSLPLVNPGAAGEGTYVLVHPRLQGSVSLWKPQPEERERGSLRPFSQPGL